MKPKVVEEWTDYGIKSKNHNHSLDIVIFVEFGQFGLNMAQNLF